MRSDRFGLLPLGIYIDLSVYCSSRIIPLFFLQVIDILERERKELQQQILAEIDTTEIVYMEQALEMLKKQEENLKNQVNIPKDLPEEPKVDNVPTVYEKQSANTSRIDWFDEDEGAACMESIQEHLADMEIADASTELSNLNPEAVEFEIKDFDDDQAEEFPLIESTPPPEDEPTIDGNWLSDIDKDNQLKYFYFYQGNSKIFVILLDLEFSCQIFLFSNPWSRSNAYVYGKL